MTSTNMSSPSRKTVLFAEDDQMVGNLYSLVLENAGFNVELVEDGNVLVERFQRIEPDAVLVDLMLPGLHGVDAIRAIRALPGGTNVPIIAVTSSFVPEFIKGTKAAGANTILSKMDLNPTVLIHTLNLFLLSKPPSLAA